MRYGRADRFTEKWARKSPDKTALTVGGESISYGLLEEHVQDIHESLLSQGIGRGEVVAALMGSCAEFVASFFAVLRAGAVFFPMNPKLTGAERIMLLGESGASRIIRTKDTPIDERLLKESRLASSCSVDISGGKCSLKSRPLSDSSAKKMMGKDYCLMQYSSGSTGRPKIMLKTRYNVCHEVWHFAKMLGLGAEDSFLSAAPMYHSYGLFNGMLSPMYIGASLTVADFPAPGRMLRLLREHRPAVFITSPFVLDMLAECHADGGGGIGPMRYCISSTAPLGKETADKFRRRYGVAVSDMYGSTETGTVAIRMGGPADESEGFSAMPGVRVFAYDEKMRKLPAGALGTVGVRSPSACVGYLNADGESGMTFRRGMVFPGDVGFTDESGLLHVVRRDDVINVAGLKVDMAEVRNALMSCPNVADAAVFGMESDGSHVVGAAVVFKGKATSTEGVQKLCRRRLADYKVPKIIVALDALPRDENGKVVAWRLKELAAAKAGTCLRAR